MKTYFLISKVVSLVIVFLFIAIATIPVQTFAAPSLQEEGSPLADQTWVRLGGPPGGIGYDIKVNPDNPDIMYVTDSFAGIHKSEDAGISWRNFNQGIDVKGGFSGDAIPVFCVTVDPNDHNIIWVGLLNEKGIYRSTDGGISWEKRTEGIVEDEGLTIRGIAVEPGNSDIVYAAGEISSWTWAGQQVLGRQFDKVKGVIYKSENGGLTWRAVWRGENLARYVLVDSNNTNILYASTGIFDREAANSSYENKIPGGEGILKSYDKGETWEPINTGLENLYVGSLAMHPTDPHILLAGVGNQAYNTGSGIYLSIDSGATWQLVGGEGTNVSAVDFASSNTNIFYAASEIAFLRSEDSGKTWEEYRNSAIGFGWGPPGINPGIPIDIQVDPRDPNRVFVNNYAGGNVLSTDGGATWSSASNGYTGEQITNLAVAPNNPAVIYSNGKSGFFKSMDGGINWQGILPIELMGTAYSGEVALDPINFNKAYFSNSEGYLFVSKNGGATWEKIFGDANAMWAVYRDTPRLYFQGFTRVAFAPSDTKRVYAGFGHLFYCVHTLEQEICQEPTYKNISFLVSNDGGATWSIIENSKISGITIADVVVHPENPEIVWVVSPWHGVYKSLNGGRDWENTSSGLNLKVSNITINPKIPDMLFAGAQNDGIYISIDGGLTWKKSSSGMEPNETVTSIVIDPLRANVIYAGGKRGGVYLSEDQGKSWRLINNGLSTRSVITLEISSDGLVLYAGTYGEGVFRLSTHDQVYFDSLAPTPTAIPSTITSTSLAPEAPATTSTPVSSTTPSTALESSTIPIYISVAIVLLIGLIAFALWRRKSRGE